MGTPSETSSTGSPALPLRPALKQEEDNEPASVAQKVVSIAEPETSPLSSPQHPSSEDLRERPKQFNAGVGARRLSGRPNMYSSSSSRLSLISQSSFDDTDTSTPHSHSNSRPNGLVSTSEKGNEHTNGSVEGNNYQHRHGHLHSHTHRHEHNEHRHDKLLTQVAGWLQAEKAKRAARRAKKSAGGPTSEPFENDGARMFRPRTASMSSDSSAISLEKLQRILEDNMSSFGYESLPSTPETRRTSHSARRRSSIRKLGGTASSDTEYQDGDVVVPSCNVVLDNSKTMSYSGGNAVVESSNSTYTVNASKRAEKERKYWLQFKSEILRLAHTLRLKGWRRVPLERGGEIEVERLSGALTNAVYVVSPPKEPSIYTSTDPNGKHHTPKPPPKLLLRIYGPQVEHLIDRENELGILRRLARKKIGPRLLGTFTNGRFEEFFNAQTLTAEDLRIEDTSKQIAKRMRELHDGIDLLDREREEGPFVWRNWDKWVDRCEEVITFLDGEILGKKPGKGEVWRQRGLVCGVEWRVFKDAVDRYRKWLDEYYRKRGGVENRLVFAHNDTQYGNILRLIPPSTLTPSADGSIPPPSPLLLPQNHHKQLVVIDFEYASANTPGLEFANHFTEWCYNYHDPVAPWACHTSRYPTLEQQRGFIRSYVNHRPQFNPRASATPKLLPMDSTTSGMRGGVNEFLLDSRTPGYTKAEDTYFPRPPSSIGSTSSLNLNSKLEDSPYYQEEEKRQEKEVERNVAFLMDETRIWRVANSAQWVAWGIVQAKVEELDDHDKTPEARSPVDGEHSMLDQGLVASPEPESHLNKPSSPSLEHDKRLECLNAEAVSQGHEEIKEGDKALEDAEAEAEFDYLAYAQNRALFFWGDVVGLGIVGRDELPASLVSSLREVNY
ncbi:kinase-like domain-containing protein [Tricladium varicosporioides]|nr:kinase-like domain-containing protein [Hymenoscyphus varicosporioides]